MSRILLTTLLIPAGTLQDCFRDLIATLRARGHEVTLWSPLPLLEK